MYKIEIYDKEFNKITTLLNKSDFYALEYELELNKVGGASFKARVLGDKSTLTNFKIFNRVKIYKGSTVKFVGYIEELAVTSDEITINCLGLIGLFKRRLTSSSVGGGAVSSFYGLLNATNALDDTKVSQGSGTVSYTITQVDFSRSNILSAWQKIAEMAGDAEFQINPSDLTLDFKASIGYDRSNSVVLEYDINFVDKANLYKFDAEVSGKDTYNKIIGIGGSSLTSTKQDATSITEFGLLETSENYSETEDQTDLDNQTQNYLDGHKDEFYVPKLKVNLNKISIDAFAIGDLVQVKLNNGFLSIDQKSRIIKRKIVVAESNQEELDIEIVSEDLKKLPTPPITGDIDSLQKRLSLLEGQI